MSLILRLPLTVNHLEFLITVEPSPTKLYLLGARKQLIAMELEKAGLVKIESLRDEITEKTANWVIISEAGKLALQHLVDQLNVCAGVAGL